MAAQDVVGSRAHARMLAEQGIISLAEDQAAIDSGLEKIAAQIADGTFAWDVNDEDVHMAIERALTANIGTPGAPAHGPLVTTRWQPISACSPKTSARASWTRTALCAVPSSTLPKNLDVVMPGYTHLQHAQPVAPVAPPARVLDVHARLRPSVRRP